LFTKAKTILELGSEQATHQTLYPKHWNVTHSNLESSNEKILSIDMEKQFSLESSSYDGVVTFNTLYAIYNVEQCIAESLRVARLFVAFNIPFITKSTPHPHDYTRMTKERLVRLLEDLKQKTLLSNFTIISYGGTGSAIGTLLTPYIPFKIIRIPLLLLLRLIDHFDQFRKVEAPLGYFVIVQK
jgi:hypothetical protein